MRLKKKPLVIISPILYKEENCSSREINQIEQGCTNYYGCGDAKPDLPFLSLLYTVVLKESYMTSKSISLLMARVCLKVMEHEPSPDSTPQISGPVHSMYIQDGALVIFLSCSS